MKRVIVLVALALVAAIATRLVLRHGDTELARIKGLYSCDQLRVAGDNASAARATATDDDGRSRAQAHVAAVATRQDEVHCKPTPEPSAAAS